MPRKSSAKRTVTNTEQVNANEESRLSALLNEKAAAAYIGVSLQYLRLWRYGINPHEGPQFVRFKGFGSKNGKNSGRVLYPRDELDKWLSALTRYQVVGIVDKP